MRWLERPLCVSAWTALAVDTDGRGGMDKYSVGVVLHRDMDSVGSRVGVCEVAHSYWMVVVGVSFGEGCR